MPDWLYECPFCHADLVYVAEGVRYSRLISIEIPCKYDGVLAWECPDCGAVWDRWPGRPSGIATHEVPR